MLVLPRILSRSSQVWQPLAPAPCTLGVRFWTGHPRRVGRRSVRPSNGGGCRRSRFQASRDIRLDLLEHAAPPSRVHLPLTPFATGRLLQRGPLTEATGALHHERAALVEQEEIRTWKRGAGFVGDLESCPAQRVGGGATQLTDINQHARDHAASAPRVMASRVHTASTVVEAASSRRRTGSPAQPVRADAEVCVHSVAGQGT